VPTAALRRVLAFTGALALGLAGTLVATPAPAHAAVTVDPVPLAPAAGSYVSDSTPRFSWQHGDGQYIFSHAVRVKDSGGVVRGSIVQFASPWTPIIPLRDGAYTWQVRGQDLTGSGSWSTAVPFVVDTTAPDLVLTAPAAGTFGGGAVTVTGTVSDANPGTVTLTHNGMVIATDSSGDADFSFTFIPTTGAHTLVVTAVDKAGNSDAGSTATVALVVDADAPNLAILSPADGSWVKVGSAVEFHATANDANRYSWNGRLDDVGIPGAYGHLLTGHVDYRRSVDTSGWAHLSSHTLLFTANDEFGQKSTLTSTVMADSSRPVVTFLTPARLSSVAGAVDVSGTATDTGSGIAEFKLEVRKLNPSGSCGAFLGSGHVVPVASDGSWSVVVDTTEYGDGEFCFTALASDRVGNDNAGGHHLKSVEFDNSAPTGTLTALYPQGFTLTADHFSWTPLSDPNGVTYEVVLGNHPNVDADGLMTSGLVPVGSSTSTSLAYDHPTGPAFWQVRAVDDLGNATAWTAPRGFQVIGVPEIVYPTPGLQFSATKLMAQWSPSFGVGGVARYEIEYGLDRDHDGVLTYEYRSVAGHTAWPAGPQTREQNFSAGYEGPLTIRVRAIYNIPLGGSVEGPWSAPAVSYLRDTAAPTVTIDAPGAGAVLKGDVAIPVTVTGRDAAGISRLTADLYESDGTTFVGPIGSTPPGGVIGATATRTWDIPVGLAEGGYVIVASSTDAAGKTTETTRSFTIDRTRPTVTIDAPADGASLNSDVTVTVTGVDPNGIAGLAANLYDASNSNPLLRSIGSARFVDGGTTHTATWTIPLSWFTADGTYTVRAGATDAAGNNRTVTARFTIDRTGPAAPQPVNPQNGLMQANDAPVLDWNPVSDAVSYEVRTSTSPGRTPNVNDGQLNGADAATFAAGTDEFALSGLGQGWLWWQVRGIDALGNIGPWSNIWATGVDTLGPTVTLTSPADGAVLTTGAFTLSWTANEPGSTFEVGSSALGATDPATNELLSGTVVTRATNSSAVSGAPEGTYFWQVRATDALGNVGGWTAPFSLTVDLPTLAVPPTGSQAAPPPAGPAGGAPADLTTLALETAPGDGDDDGEGEGEGEGNGDASATGGGSADGEPTTINLVPAGGVDSGVMWMIGALVFAALLLFLLFAARRRRNHQA